jgi:hypothetical protein
VQGLNRTILATAITVRLGPRFYGIFKVPSTLP